MSNSVPKYYPHLADETGEESGPERQADPEDEQTDSQSTPSEPTVYRADAFRLPLPEDEWRDGSVYTLTGPTIDGVTHNIAVNMDDDVEADSVYDFAAQEIALLKPQLDGCRVLLDGPLELNCGRPATATPFV